jgi:hypothetical protein
MAQRLQQITAAHRADTCGCTAMRFVAVQDNETLSTSRSAPLMCRSYSNPPEAITRAVSRMPEKSSERSEFPSEISEFLSDESQFSWDFSQFLWEG